MTKPETPKELDAIVDLILAYKAKPKSAPGKKRKKKAAKVAKALPVDQEHEQSSQ